MTAHDGGTGLRLLGLPAGRITLRDARTATTREVGLLPFSIGATPVTIGDWHRVLGTAVVPGHRRRAWGRSVAAGQCDVRRHVAT